MKASVLTRRTPSFASRILTTSLAAVLLVGGLQAGSPRLQQTTPGGCQRGGEIEIVCSGSNLENGRTLLFDEPGFTVEPVPEKTPQKNRFKFKVKVAPEVRLGEHRYRLITGSGVSDVRLFYVTPFPMVSEVEKKDAPTAAQPIALGTTVYGNTQEDDQDRFEVELKKGQRLSVEAIGSRLQTQNIYDPYVSITKADGTLVIDADDVAYSRQDPVMSMMAPEDGKYIVTIKDSTNSGPGACHYLLNIGNFPRPLAVYPPGGPSGKELKVKLIGDAGGEYEQTVKLPDQPQERFEVYTQGDQPTPQPLYVRVSNLPNVLEAAEPNDLITNATVTDLAPPVAFNGIIDKANDADTFKFSAKKDQTFDLTVWARRLRSPLDSLIEIYNEKGARLATNDDAGNSDSYLRWKAPADGNYFLTIRDQLFRGGANFTYRVEMTNIEPKLTAWLPEMTLNQNQDRRAIAVPKGNRYASLVRVKRTDIGGDVKLEPADLPPGVTAQIPLIDKSVDTVPVVFEATADAAPAQQAVTLTPKLTETPANTTVISKVEHDTDVVENGNQRPYYTVKENNLALAVSDEIPVTINLEQPKAQLLQTGSLGLKVKLERRNDFKGPVGIALLYAPPGVGSPGTVQVKEGENEGVVTISANNNAPLQKWKVCVVGTADFGKGPVWFSTQHVEIEVAPPLITGNIVRSFVDQGDATTVTVKIDQKVPFEGKAKLQLQGLPPTVTADEQEITKDTTEVRFNVKAGAAAPAGQHKQLVCLFTFVKDGDTMSSSFGQGGILRIDKAAVAKNEEPKK